MLKISIATISEWGLFQFTIPSISSTQYKSRNGEVESVMKMKTFSSGNTKEKKPSQGSIQQAFIHHWRAHCDTYWFSEFKALLVLERNKMSVLFLSFSGYSLLVMNVIVYLGRNLGSITFISFQTKLIVNLHIIVALSINL